MLVKPIEMFDVAGVSPPIGQAEIGPMWPVVDACRLSSAFG
jgi:hypothetical protein